jgi:hypothetical protein
MSLRLGLLMASDLLLLLSSLIYGVLFIKKRNWLIGLEWLVITVSTTNLMIFLFTNNPANYSFSFFLDQFSRAIGIPVITIVGLMAVTHRYKPSVISDIALFALGGVVGYAFAFTGFAASFKPYFLVLAWTVFSIYLAYFAKRLWSAGEKTQALNVIAVLVTAQIIATIYDFWHIPGDDELHSIFYTFALTVWAYTTAGLYYAYGALERAERR